MTRRLPTADARRALRRIALALAVSAALAGSFASLAPAYAAPTPEPKRECMVLGTMVQCMGPGGMSQQSSGGGMVQIQGPGGSFQSGGNVVQSSSSVQISGNGNTVQTITGNGTSVQTITSNGTSTQIQTTGGAFPVLPGISIQSSAAMPALPTDVPVAITVDRGDGGTYRVGETVQVAYAVNEPIVFRVVAVQDSAATTLVEGSGDGTRGQVSAVAGPAAGTQTFRLVGLANDGSVREATITINVVP